MYDLPEPIREDGLTLRPENQPRFSEDVVKRRGRSQTTSMITEGFAAVPESGNANC